MSCNLCRHIPTAVSLFDDLSLSLVSEKTQQQYQTNLVYISTWMDEHEYPDELPLSPALLIHYAEDMVKDGKRVNTIKQRLFAVSWLHTYCGYSSNDNPMHHPDMRNITQQIKAGRTRLNFDNKPQQKKPLTAKQIKQLCKQCAPDTMIGQRNRLIILIGFHAALRRSELAGLKVKDVSIHEDGGTAVITLDKSKGDKFNVGQSVKIYAGKDARYCPIKNLQFYLQITGIITGPLFPQFRYGRMQQAIVQPSYINVLLKRLCRAAGIDPENIGCHSLRRGLLIAAAEKGADINTLRVHARHSESSMTEHYIGQAHLKSGNASKGVLD